jgi:hypothetical protein
MSAKNLFALTLAAVSINFLQDVRVIKASKKDKDAAKAKGVAEDSAEYPKDKQLPLVRPDFSDKPNAVAFIGAFYDAAEKTKAGSADELLAKVFRARTGDATEQAITADGELDPDKYVKFLTSEVSGTKTLSQLEGEKSALATELITLGEFYQLNESDVAALNTAGYSDAQALLLVISNKRRAWGEIGAVVDARKAEAAKKKAKKDAKEAQKTA